MTTPLKDYIDTPRLLIGQTITSIDPRTGYTYQATILGARVHFGKLRVSVTQNVGRGGLLWFEPTPAELQSVGQEVAV